MLPKLKYKLRHFSLFVAINQSINPNINARLIFLRKQGLGTWALGDLGAWGPGDLRAWGPEGLGTWGQAAELLLW